jgi:tetratricopeptide (TPR) repeat protein
MRETKVSLRAGRVLDAYRQTPAEVRAALETHDAQWVQVGVLLENACLLAPGLRDAHLVAATDSVRATLGPERWAEGHRVDPVRPATGRSLVGRFRSYCEIVEDAGALLLADAMLSAYVDADLTVDAIERGRVEAVRARLAWKAGDLDAATERYRRVAVAGKRERSDELKIRALVGQSIVARNLGNYPRVRERAQRAASLAERRGMRRLAATARQMLTVGFAVARDFGIAVTHGWQAYLNGMGDPIMESEALQIIGQLFLDMGHPEPAAAAFRTIISRAPTDRFLVPSLGGLAVAASRMGERDTVSWAEDVVAARMRSGATPYTSASAQLDFAIAWEELGVTSRADEARRRAMTIALKHRFHEIAHHAEERQVVPAPAPATLSAETEEVVDAVLQLATV